MSIYSTKVEYWKGTTGKLWVAVQPIQSLEPLAGPLSCQMSASLWNSWQHHFFKVQIARVGLRSPHSWTYCPHNAKTNVHICALKDAFLLNISPSISNPGMPVSAAQKVLPNDFFIGSVNSTAHLANKTLGSYFSRFRCILSCKTILFWSTWKLACVIWGL